MELFDRSTPISVATAAMRKAKVGVEISTVGFNRPLASMCPLVSRPPPEITRQPRRRAPQYALQKPAKLPQPKAKYKVSVGRMPSAQNPYTQDSP